MENRDGNNSGLMFWFRAFSSFGVSFSKRSEAVHEGFPVCRQKAEQEPLALKTHPLESYGQI